MSGGGNGFPGYGGWFFLGFNWRWSCCLGSGGLRSLPEQRQNATKRNKKFQRHMFAYSRDKNITDLLTTSQKFPGDFTNWRVFGIQFVVQFTDLIGGEM